MKIGLSIPLMLLILNTFLYTIHTHVYEPTKRDRNVTHRPDYGLAHAHATKPTKEISVYYYGIRVRTKHTRVSHARYIQHARFSNYDVHHTFILFMTIFLR